MDTRIRSWVKSLTWRIAGIVILGVISYAFTRDLAKTTSITVVFHVLRLFLYYSHERIWEKISWGRIRHPLAHLPLKENLSHDDFRAIERFLAEQKYLAQQPEYEI